MAASPLFNEMAAFSDSESEHAAYLRSFPEGKANVPELSPQTSKDWAAQQKKALRNPSKQIIESASSSIELVGFTVEDNVEAENEINRIRRLTQFDARLEEVYHAGFTEREAWLMYGFDKRGLVLTAETKRTMAAVHDPLRGDGSVDRAIKSWREGDVDRAFLWYRDEAGDVIREEWKRPAESRAGNKHLRLAGGSWKLQNEVELDTMPIVSFRPTLDGMARHEPHLALIQAVDIVSLALLIATTLSKDRILDLKGDLAKAYANKDQGVVDAINAVLGASPYLTKVMPEGASFSETSQTDYRPLIEALATLIKQLAAQSGTPESWLSGGTQNASAEAALTAREPLVASAKSTIRRTKPATELMIVKMLEAAKPGLLGDSLVNANYASPRTVTESEQQQATNMQLRAAAGWPLEANLRAAGIPPEEIQRIVTERLQDAFLAETQVTAQAAIAARVATTPEASTDEQLRTAMPTPGAPVPGPTPRTVVSAQRMQPEDGSWPGDPK